MHPKALTLTEAARNFSDFINRVAYKHERFVLCRGRKAVAELRPVPSGRRLGDLLGILRSLPHLSQEEADAFSKDLTEARQGLPAEGLRDPWES